MTEEEKNRAQLVEEMSEVQRAEFFAMCRKFVGCNVDLYDDEFGLIYSLSEVELDRLDAEHGFTIEYPADRTRTMTAHIRMGEWEFWQSVIGRDTSDLGFKQFTVRLP